MNCTSVLHAFGGHPQQSVVPVELAMRWCLTQSRPLYHLLAVSPPNTSAALCEPRDRCRQPTAASPSPAALPERSEPRSCFRRRRSGAASGGNKKRVVFADAKGLALAVVRLFFPEPAAAATMARGPSPLAGMPLMKRPGYKLRLGFPPPLLDFKDFFSRLKDSLVQLETCSVTEWWLSGTVRVRNISPEKAVHVRVTFDSWRSHWDVPCTLLQQRQQQQRYGHPDTDAFAFDVALPWNLDPGERLEFAVAFKPCCDGTPLWDNNRGMNYRVFVEAEGSRRQSTRAVPPPQRCATSLDVKSCVSPRSPLTRQSWGHPDTFLPFDTSGNYSGHCP